MYRYDAHSGGEREIQRTMLELLNQLDGFDARADVKVILATNRIESLDPALLRPGRIDRKIEFPLPDIKTRRRIFQVHLLELYLLLKCVLGFSLIVCFYLYITPFHCISSAFFPHGNMPYLEIGVHFWCVQHYPCIYVTSDPD